MTPPLLKPSTLRFFATIEAAGASFSRSEALVGGDDARGEDFVGDVFLLFIEVEVIVPREFWLASDGRCLSLGAGRGCLGLMRFDNGVPELELESSSSRGRLAVICCFNGSLTTGRGLATTVSLILGTCLGTAFGLGLIIGAASSSEVSELEMMACDRTLPPLALGAAVDRALVGDALAEDTLDVVLEGAADAVVLALDLPKRRLTWASCAVGFLGLVERGFEVDLDMASPPTLGRLAS